VNSAVSAAALLAVAAGGAVGSVARYLATLALMPVMGTFPAGTLVVNVVGSFLIGWFARFFSGDATQDVVRLALTTGFCGGFTTFSTFSAETLLLVQQGKGARAATYVALSLALGLGAAALGLVLGRPRA
jgi:CrcB protein